MRLLLDADALIKLNLAGVLEAVLEAYECAIPDTVYHEAVTEGRAAAHSDAESIDAALASDCEILETFLPRPALPGLGPGELALLQLLVDVPDAMLVTDDRRFITMLASRSIAFLTPAQLIIEIAREKVLSPHDSLEALDQMKFAISQRSYLEAHEEIEAIAGGRDEEN